jgi:hypothetical protein
VRELVIVIQDLYLPAEPAARAALHGVTPPLAGLGFVARFGAREMLPHGWRAWLAGWVGRGDLAGIAPARIAAAVHPGLADAPGTLWIAAPVHLSAGLSRVHLDPRGLLYLSAAELAQLAQDFARAFAGSGFALTPASPRELLLLTPGVEAVATAEPARFAGAEVNDALPRGPAAAGLRRTWTEMEMWLHAHPPNQARRLPVTALWPWGAQGGTVPPAPAAAAPTAPAAFAADAYVRGLWHICGGDCRAVPEVFGAVADSRSERAVLVVEAGALLQDSSGGFGGALALLDARYLVPAVQALRAGHIGRLHLIANDRCLSVRARSALKVWRRVPAGVAALT